MMALTNVITMSSLMTLLTVRFMMALLIIHACGGLDGIDGYALHDGLDD
jgi:hypothetical protein